MADLFKCPHCSVVVGPTTDGRCPACGQPIASGGGTPGYVLQIPPQFQSGPTPQSQAARFGAALYASTPRVWVTPTLIAINVVIFLAMLATSMSFSPNPRTVLAWGANFGPKTLNGEWWRLFSAMFLHFNVLHIGLNMWALHNLGRLTERLVGNVGFLLLYVLSGLLASLASVAWNPEVTSAGASGAVFGIGGALLGFLLLRRDSIPASVLVPLRNSMFGFIGYNVVFGFIVPGIDNAAHLGGLAAGFGCGMILSQEISPEGTRRRWLRNALLLVVGAAVAGGAFWLLPDAPPDWQAELQMLTETEHRVISRYNDLAGRVDNGKLTEREFADEIDGKLIPELSAAKQRFAALRASSAQQRKVADEFGKYLELRLESWKSLVIALRGDDHAALKRFREQSAAADRLSQ